MFNFFKKRKQLKTTETPTEEQPLTPIVVVETEEDRWAKQYVFDFLEGKVHAKQFLKDIIEKKEIFAWLEKIQPKRKEEYGEVQSNWTVKKVVAPYNIKRKDGATRLFLSNFRTNFGVGEYNFIELWLNLRKGEL